MTEKRPNIWREALIIELSESIAQYTKARRVDRVSLYMMDKKAFQLSKLVADHVAEKLKSIPK